MLAFVSDLHLADAPARSCTDVSALLRRLRSVVTGASAQGARRIELVFLGDVFEILKSEHWLSNRVRPWDKSSDVHVRTVNAIFESICVSNKEFFSGLEELRSSFPIVSFRYVPGNHDRPLNTEMGDGARARLRDLLHLEGRGNKRFDEYFIDDEHRVVAKHGHEWDPLNRYSSRGAAVGDAVVVDLLVRLATLIREKLKLDVDDPLVRMVNEMDNVRPQAPKSMAQWILSSLDRLGQKEYPDLRHVIGELFERLLADFRALRKSVTFESFETATWWENFLGKVIEGSVKLFGALSTSLVLPAGGETAGPYADFAAKDLEISRIQGDYWYILCGHTHIPEIIPLGMSRRSGSRLMYFNTGAWRRVHRAARSRSPGESDTFATWDEACVVIVSNEEEQQRLGFGAYEFCRDIRG